MRKSFTGLSCLVEESFPGQLLSGSFFLFCNRRRDSVKILYWDGDGFILWYKRLEKGTFKVSIDGESIINRRHLLILLEGVKVDRFEKRFVLD
jgi:transposase